MGPDVAAFLFSILPQVVSSLLGAASNDFVTASRGRHHKPWDRVIQVSVSVVLSTFLSGFGVPVLFPNLDWKSLSLVAYVLGFLGFRLATLFSVTTAGLRILGQNNLADAVDHEELKLKTEKLEQKRSLDRDVEEEPPENAS